MEQKHSPECAEIHFSGYSQITSALPTPHITATTQGCRQRFLSTFSLFYTELLLPGIISRVPALPAAASMPLSPLEPGGSRRDRPCLAAGAAAAGLLRAGACTHRLPRGCSPHPSSRGVGSGASAHGELRAGWQPPPPAERAPRRARHLRALRLTWHRGADGALGSAGRHRGGSGAGWDALLPTPSQVPARPRAPRLYGLRAGPRCQSAVPGRAPGSPLRGGDINSTAPSPPRLPAGPSPARARPRRAVQGRCGGRAGGSGLPPGAEGRAGERSPRSVWRGLSTAEPPGGGARLRGGAGAWPGPAVGASRARFPRARNASAAPPAGPALRGHLSLESSMLLPPPWQNPAFSRAKSSHFYPFYF